MQENQKNETVREFIDRIFSNEFCGDEVKVFSQDSKEYQEFIKIYLEKMRKLLERKNRNNNEIDKTLTFLANNLKRNVKYIVDVEYTDAEKKLANEIFQEEIKVKGETREEREEKRKILRKEMIVKSPVGKSYIAKQSVGARPRPIYSGKNSS